MVGACDEAPEDPFTTPKNSIAGDVLCEEAKLHSDFKWIQKYAIEPNCVATLCHNSDSSLEKIDLNLEFAYTHLMESTSEYSALPLVDPNRPENSYLMVVLGEYDQEQLETRPMPLTLPMCQPILDAVNRWILAGAKND